MKVNFRFRDSFCSACCIMVEFENMDLLKKALKEAGVKTVQRWLDDYDPNIFGNDISVSDITEEAIAKRGVFRVSLIPVFEKNPNKQWDELKKAFKKYSIKP